MARRITMEPEREHEKREQESHEERTTRKVRVIISVNEQPVKLQGHTATGAEIKAAAIRTKECTSAKLRLTGRARMDQPASLEITHKSPA